MNTNIIFKKHQKSLPCFQANFPIQKKKSIHEMAKESIQKMGDIPIKLLPYLFFLLVSMSLPIISSPLISPSKVSASLFLCTMLLRCSHGPHLTLQLKGQKPLEVCDTYLFPSSPSWPSFYLSVGFQHM